MKKLSLYVLVIALSAGSAATVQTMRTQANSDITASIDANGAFRDGLYLGKLAARRGEQPHVAIARWATDDDRAAFREGYERGFSQTLSERAPSED
jgi:hypothetical protein